MTPPNANTSQQDLAPLSDLRDRLARSEQRIDSNATGLHTLESKIITEIGNVRNEVTGGFGQVSNSLTELRAIIKSGEDRRTEMKGELEKRDSTISELTNELKSHREHAMQAQKEREERDKKQDERLLKLESEFKPIRDWFWKAIGLIVFSVIGAVLGLVIINNGN
jgi:chromosome segregation ATPase